MPQTEIVILTEAQIPAKFQPQNMYPLPHDRFVERSAEFRAWLEETATFYYAHPAEDFFEHEAFELAAAAGCVALIMENMS
jgi:hypothetical protein